MHIENMDFAELIKLYDKPTTLFYCDPPYMEKTRAEGAKNTYKHEMPVERHAELLTQLQAIQGQAVVSGYDCDLYNYKLHLWRTVRKTTKSSIQNRNSIEDRDSRTEVLWIKEHHYGLWGQP
jgi:DNA adenine methylase